MSPRAAALVVIAGAITACYSRQPEPPGTNQAAAVRSELNKLYAENTAAFMRKDLPAIMALRTPDFHTITPDGRVQDRAAMENYIQGLLNGIQKWNTVTFTIDSLSLSSNHDTAHAVVKQYVDRIALRPDNQYHHVQTWVTQRESWVRNNGSWRMWRVDQLRDQRRLVDGKPN